MTNIVELIKADGKIRIYRMSDGTRQIWKDGTASWRHNNPGNLKLEYKNSADKTVKSKRTKEQALAAGKSHYEGVIDLDQWGNLIFENIEQGNKARFKLLKNGHGNQNIRQMLDGYAIADYTGATNNEAYAQSIYSLGKSRGLNLENILIKDMNQDQFTALVDGMKKHEGFKVGTISIDTGSSVLINVINTLNQPFDGAKVTISYQPKTDKKVEKNFIADELGHIPMFDAPADSELSVTVNGKPITKKIKVEAGKIKPFTITDTASPITAKTATHEGNPKSIIPSKVKDSASHHISSTDKSVIFDILVIDETSRKPLKNARFFLEYQGHQKLHHTDENGIEKSIHANVGEIIAVFVDGYDGHHQKVTSFITSYEMGIQTAQIPSHTFDLIMKTKDCVLVHYPFSVSYRGHVKDKITNQSGTVKLTALIGEKIVLKTKDGDNIISFIVDKTKQSFACLLSLDTATEHDDETKGVEEEKVGNPAAKDISPKHKVTDEKSAKGNPVTSVSTSKDSDKYLFPLNVKAKPRSYEKTTMGAFGARRSHGKRTHAGCDLYAMAGTEVRAMADGIVRIVSYFYENTDQIEIVHKSIL
jgi:hypothetical protein